MGERTVRSIGQAGRCPCNLARCGKMGREREKKGFAVCVCVCV